jgi:hypothetical protein
MRKILAALLLSLGSSIAFAQGQDCTGEPSPVLKISEPQSTVDTIKITAGISTLMRPFSSLSSEVKGSDIELTIVGMLQATPQDPFICTTFRVGPLAAGTYNVKLFQSVGPTAAPVVTMVASEPLVISDAGAPLFTNVIPRYPLANQALSVRVRAVTPAFPAVVHPHQTTVVGNVIRLEGCVNDGGFSVPDVYVATAGVAPIPAGRYRVEYHRAECDSSGHYYAPAKFLTSFDVEVKESGPNWPGPPDAVMPVSRYFHEGFGHYFITADESEQIALDSRVFDGWELWELARGNLGSDNGKFGFWRAGEGLSAVCRFFSTAFAPKSSHFYTAEASECEKVKANPNWLYEGVAGYVLPAQTATQCAQGIPLYRLYNNGQGEAPNHQYTTDARDADFQAQHGWASEGILGCVPSIAPPYRP